MDCNENSADAMWAVDFSALTTWAYLIDIFFFSFFHPSTGKQFRELLQEEVVHSCTFIPVK